ncbi:MAG: carbohydrate-binding family 9-like protein [Anaerolineales bacterium]
MSNPSFNCRKVTDRPSLSGDLTQPPWSSLPPVGELVLSDGSGKPRFGTRVWCCWDDDRFYVAFDCEDTDIRATLTERDDKVWQEEAVEFFVSTDADLEEYYEFQFSPRNVVRDIHVHNPHGRMEGSVFDGNWDCEGLRSAVKLDGTLNDPGKLDRGWSLEAALPLECLLGKGQRAEVGMVWRINFFRIYRWPEEQFNSFSPTFVEPWEFHVPEYFAHMTLVAP